MDRTKKTAARLITAGLLVGGSLWMGAGTALAGEPPLDYPPVVEQGQSFTLGAAVPCFGRVAGGLDEDNWGDVSFDATGEWEVQIAVPLDAAPGDYTWDIQCLPTEGGSFFYAFSTIEVVPQGTLPTIPDTTPDTAPDTAPTTAAATPTTAAAAQAVGARPRFTG